MIDLKKNQGRLDIQAVVFDMDGVITHTMPDHFRAWREILAAEGVHVSHHDIYSREGQRGITSLQEIFSEKGVVYSRRTAQRLLREKEELFKSISRQRFIPGARNFIRSLHRRGYRLGLVTGTSRHELHRILPDALYKLFDVTVTGDEVGNGKPHPEPFIKALRELAIDPRQAIVIENAPFGIAAAKAAGLKCLALETSLPRAYLQDADLVFESIRDLQARIRFPGRRAGHA
ncbi:MAG: HAD family phosphatase [Candidatus Omnitrophota bacterium]|nr:HAD family phosphatase [Candidatus Omnitrophota bacterium]